MKRGMIRLIFLLTSLTLVFLSCGKVTQEVAKKTEKEVKTFDLLLNVEAIRPTDPRLNPKTILHKDEHYLSLRNEFELNKNLDLIVVVQGIRKNEGLTNLSWGRIEINEEKPKKEREPEKTTSEVLSELRAEAVSANAQDTDSDEDEDVEKSKEPVFIHTAYNQHKLKISASNYNDAHLKLLPVTEENELKKYKVDIKAIKIRYDYDGYIIKVFSDQNTYRLFSFTKQTAEDNQTYNIGDLTLYQTFINTLFLTSLKANDYMLEVAVSPSYDMFNRLYPPEFFETLDAYQLPENSVKKFKERVPDFNFDKDTLVDELVKIMEIMLTTSKSDAKRYIDEHKKLPLSKVSKRFIKSRIDAFILPGEEQAKDSSSDEGSDGDSSEASSEEGQEEYSDG